MASCLFSFCVSIKPSLNKHNNTRQGVQIRSQSFSDEGNSLFASHAINLCLLLQVIYIAQL